MRHQAVSNLYPNVHNQVGDKAFDVEGDPVDINETKVAEEVKRLEAEYSSKEYQRDRADAYPSWQTQLDQLFHQGYDGWKAEVQKVKDQFPKP